MSRSGQYVQQVSGYKAFMPGSLPFGGELELSTKTQALLLEANRALVQLDGLGKNLPNHGLKQARYVPPPMDLVPKLMGDLEQFMHGEGTGHHLVDCALIHYQFETIHPFLDGNGRVGRILIPIFLCWKGLQTHPLLYLSLFMKIHRQEYFDRMMLLREKGDYEQWVNFFLEGVRWTAENAQDSIRSILTLKEQLLKALEGDSRCSLKSVQMLDLLFLSPIVTIGTIAERLGVSRQWTTKQVAVFEDLKVLKEITGRRRGKRFLFADYLAILDSTS